MENPEIPEPKQETTSLTEEYLNTLSTLEVEVEGNFGEILDKFNTDKGLNLQPRQEGHHVTVIGPAESKILSALSHQQIEELQKINDDIQRGIGTEVQGLGFIDGSQREDARNADKGKKVLFMALNLPAIQSFRKSLGLSHKDLHVTIGFEGGDIHLHKIGVDSKGKDILKPIQKKADAQYNGYADQIRNITFGGFGGEGERKTKRKIIIQKKIMEREKLVEEGEQPKVRIQSFEPKYQDSAYDCVREVRRVQYNEPKAEVKPRYKDIHKNCQRFPNEDFWIAVDEPTDKVVGTVGLRFLKEGVGQFIRLNVRPAFEGRGIGSQLINEVMAFAKANQYKEIYLTTQSDEEHAKARGMYERRDFKQTGLNDLPKDTLDLLLAGDDNIKHIEEGKTLIYKLELEQ